MIKKGQKISCQSPFNNKFFLFRGLFLWLVICPPFENDISAIFFTVLHFFSFFPLSISSFIPFPLFHLFPPPLSTPSPLFSALASSNVSCCCRKADAEPPGAEAWDRVAVAHPRPLPHGGEAQLPQEKHLQGTPSRRETPSIHGYICRKLFLPVGMWAIVSEMKRSVISRIRSKFLCALFPKNMFMVFS